MMTFVWVKYDEYEAVKVQVNQCADVNDLKNRMIGHELKEQLSGFNSSMIVISHPHISQLGGMSIDKLMSQFESYPNSYEFPLLAKLVDAAKKGIVRHLGGLSIEQLKEEFVKFPNSYQNSLLVNVVDTSKKKSIYLYLF